MLAHTQEVNVRIAFCFTTFLKTNGKNFYIPKQQFETFFKFLTYVASQPAQLAFFLSLSNETIYSAAASCMNNLYT